MLDAVSRWDPFRGNIQRLPELTARLKARQAALLEPNAETPPAVQPRMVPCALPVPRTVTPAGSGRALYVSLTAAHVSPFTDRAGAATNIQDAVNAAAEGDVVWVAGGTYAVDQPITIEKGITVLSEAGATGTRIDGQNRSRGFVVKHRGAVLDGFTIVRGFSSSRGGGLFLQDGGCVRNCIVTDCRAHSGGGLALDRGGTLEGCVVRNNRVGRSGRGGGIQVAGGRIRRCTITDNHTESRGAVPVRFLW